MPIKADKSLRAYYNEIDPFAAQWIRNLMAEGWITKGDVDERSIEDVQPNDIAGYDRLHFFAGVAVWDYALNQAGWGRGEIWTGSCPCQPFSAAGKGAGFSDERHLWPAFNHLISQCKPAIVLGEQVASKDADTWIDLVHTDLEALGYAFGAIPFPASGVGSPHIRDRLYWVADTQQHHRGSQATAANHGQPEADRPSDRTGGCGVLAGRLADAQSCGRVERVTIPERVRQGNAEKGATGRPAEYNDVESIRLADADSEQHDRGGVIGQTGRSQYPDGSATAGREPAAGPADGFWGTADWLFCRDGKWRPVEPGTFPLVDGTASRVVRLRAYGNSITAQAAQAFIECVM